MRSGEYKQCTEVLQDEYGYCCLGVACKVAQENGVNVEIDPEDGMLVGANLGDQLEVQDWLGLKTDEGTIKDGYLYERQYLTSLNDIERKSFEEIADYIEEYSDVLFMEPK